MLKGIPPILSPELLHVLMSMGHGDEIVLADGNFPAAACAQRLVRADGHAVPALLDAVLRLMPLDHFEPFQAGLMSVVPGDPTVPVIWDEYRAIIGRHEQQYEIEMIERFAFYERAKRAFCIVATSESALYANIVLKKGVIK